MFDHHALRFIILAILWSLFGCASLSADKEHSAGDFEAPGDMDSDGTCIVEEGVDSDNDGLLDIYEDLNRNCLVDEGETDPYNPDTDGDGLLDGDEDADGNGVWDADRGELNPLLQDTEGNGIPDAEEPKAQVCNRAHAERALSERRILPQNGVLYVHPGIKDAAPFGDTNAVFLTGFEDQSAGIIVESPFGSSMFQELVGTLSEGLFGSSDEGYIELRHTYENQHRGTVEALLRLEEHRLSLDKMMAFLGNYVPALKEPMAFRESYRPTSTRWDVQLLGEQLDEERTRWAISWKPAETSDEWFSIVRPSLMGSSEGRTVRFVCENIEVRSRPRLDVLLLIDDDALDYAEYWLHTLSEMVAERSRRGAMTNIHALHWAVSEKLEWTEADVAIDTGEYELVIPAIDGQAFDHLVSNSLHDLPPSVDDAKGDVLILVISGQGYFDIETNNEPLPAFPDTLQNARMVIASPTQEPYRCPWRMSEARGQSVQRLVDWGHARHVGNCASYTSDNSANNMSLITALDAVRWEQTEREPIPGTLWLADQWLSEDGHSVRADLHSVAGSRVLLAPEAKGNADSAVSFAAWFE